MAPSLARSNRDGHLKSFYRKGGQPFLPPSARLLVRRTNRQDTGQTDTVRVNGANSRS